MTPTVAMNASHVRSTEAAQFATGADRVPARSGVTWGGMSHSAPHPSKRRLVAIWRAPAACSIPTCRVGPIGFNRHIKGKMAAGNHEIHKITLITFQLL